MDALRQRKIPGNAVDTNYKEVANDFASEKMANEINVDGLRVRMQQMRNNVLEQVSDQIDDMVADVLQKLKEDKQKENDSSKAAYKYRDKRKSSKQGALPDKEFLERDSLLTDLFKVMHIRTIYNIFIVILIVLFLNTAIHDIMETGSTYVGIATISKGFGKFSTVLTIWILMKGATLGIFVALNYWAHKRLEFSPSSIKLKGWDYGWLMAYIFYQTAFVVVPTKALLDAALPVGSSIVVLMEQLRLIMKSHAFVRSAVPKFLSYKPREDAAPRSFVGPSFSQFLYFMFAPTLVYRDSYPRTKKIRWNFVALHYMEVVLVIFYVAFLNERYIVPRFQDFGSRPIEPGDLVLRVFDSIMPATLLFLSGFYCLLHAWMNASAELLQFADRLFYKDWWNCISYDSYYRTWNVVIHDWLYTYVYKDIYEIVAPGNKVLSSCVVFLISAVFHEYILSFAFRFFYPCMLIMFGGIGYSLIFLPKTYGSNIFLWFSLSCGSGLMASAYAIEYFARVNCPPRYEGSLLDVLVPRSWFCYTDRSS